MSKFSKILSAVTALAVVAVTGITMTNVSASADEASTTYSVKEYTPDKYDTINYYGGAGDIDPADGDGITTFAHIGLTTPLEGENIDFDTSFKLYSKKTVEEGGDGIDGWVTYSFAKTPADISSDGTIPSHASGADGVFIHVTNYSGTTAPNCVEVQIVQRLNGETVTLVTNFVDNIVNERMNFSLAQGEDGTYTWTLTKLGTEDVLYSVDKLSLNTEAFVNENGQTYFSTAIFEGAGCDGNHWEHRDVSIYSVDAYNVDIAAEDVVLSQTEYTYEGSACAPDVTVTLGGAELVNGVDYMVEYLNNQEVGTATAKVTFYGELGGNVVEKQFEIKAAPVIDEPVSSDDQGADSSSVPEDEPASSEDQATDSGSVSEDEPVSSEDQTADSSTAANEDQSADSSSASGDVATSSDAPASSNNDVKEKDGGCGSVVAFGSIAAMLALGGVALFARKRK